MYKNDFQIYVNDVYMDLYLYVHILVFSEFKKIKQ